MHVIDTAIFLLSLKLSYIKTGGLKGKSYVVSRYERANNIAILCRLKCLFCFCFVFYFGSCRLKRSICLNSGKLQTANKLFEYL